MIQQIDSAIVLCALSINKYLDKDRNRARDFKIEHPETSVYHAVKLQANGGVPMEINFQSDDDEAINLSSVFDEIDW